MAMAILVVVVMQLQEWQMLKPQEWSVLMKKVLVKPVVAIMTSVLHLASAAATLMTVMKMMEVSPQMNWRTQQQQQPCTNRNGNFCTFPNARQ